jgi:hypothetical protein
MDSHLIALQPGYFKRLYRLSKETFLELVTSINPRLLRKKSHGSGKAGSMDPRVMLAIITLPCRSDVPGPCVAVLHRNSNNVLWDRRDWRC